MFQRFLFAFNKKQEVLPQIRQSYKKIQKDKTSHNPTQDFVPTAILYSLFFLVLFQPVHTELTPAILLVVELIFF